ncbi:hypothetical protein OESDEN_01516 [Oesophagostomum dentatum]|uniref:Secreted protein n=1 Tax=Oesophagostomum dentatum TaxID=61180 RepID=A0A0B1TML2_OESDE|nr:hypothetical protein OESDEN_01516 [Oesophagostomum dentatum]
MLLLISFVVVHAIQAMPYYPVYPSMSHYQMDNTMGAAAEMSAPKSGNTQVPAPPVSPIPPVLTTQVVDNNTGHMGGE